MKSLIQNQIKINDFQTGGSGNSSYLIGTQPKNNLQKLLYIHLKSR
ncbi:MAG: hypothetical protein OFPII_02140 [Osedax symbiont Rs1]|nr:MAG: hypothetical protein OFPII_02140 [Osedax symbiont Rs1]